MSAHYFTRLDLCDEIPLFDQLEDETYDFNQDNMDLDLSDAGNEKTVLD